MSVRADWGLQALGVSDSPEIDPFDAASCPSMFIATSTDAAPDWLFSIDMETPEPELLRLLGLTRETQNRMMGDGIDCPLRWQEGTSCLGCPVSKADDPGSSKCQLCRTSTQEEHLETVLAAKHQDGG